LAKKWPKNGQKVNNHPMGDPLGDCLLLVVVLKITEVAKIIGLFLSTVKGTYICNNFENRRTEFHLGNFSQTHLVTLPVFHNMSLTLDVKFSPKVEFGPQG
jgi:hypothetical protein